MAALSDLIPDPAMRNSFVPRPAAVEITNFPYILSPGFVSAALVVGDLVYGLVKSARFPGNDEPFCYNVRTGRFYDVLGVQPLNVPLSPPTSGDWTPPFLAVVGSRVIACHPGFGSGAVKFGWFDLTGYSGVLVGNYTMGGTLVTGNPAIAAVQPGMILSGPAVSPDTFVVSTAPYVNVTTANTSLATVLTNVKSTKGVQAGQQVAGDGIQPGTTVVSVVGSTVTISLPAVEFAIGATIVFSSDEITTAQITTNSAVLQYVGSTDGVAVGQTVSGVGIPSGAKVVAIDGSSVTMNAPVAGANAAVPIEFSFTLNTTGSTNSSTSLTSVADTTGIAAGQTVTGTGIPAGTTVASVSGSTVVISQAATSTNTGVALTFTYQLNTFADTIVGSQVLTNLVSTTELAVGQSVYGPGVPQNTTITALSGTTATISNAIGITTLETEVTFSFSLSTTATTNDPTVLIGVANPAGLAIGQAIAGNGIAIGAVITAIAGTAVTMDLPATQEGIGTLVTFSGATVVLSAPALVQAVQGSADIAGGTVLNPLWGAGDCDRNPLPGQPVAVGQFNGRAYFGLASGQNNIVFSDPGFPCRVTNNPTVQALSTQDGLGVLALYPLMLSSPLVTTGIVQALLVFEQGGQKMQQITGDAAFNTLSMNAMPVATGTLAPLSIFTCELGTGFISPEGLRIVQFNGTVTPPIGDGGEGVTVPFLHVSTTPGTTPSTSPSRIAAAAGANTIRITAQNPNLGGQPAQEWWYDIGRKIWTGPHSFPASLIQPWQGTFIMTPVPGTKGAAAGALWRSDPIPTLVSSVYTENGQPMTCIYQPVPLPDTGALAENLLVEMAVVMQLYANAQATVIAADQNGWTLDQTTFPPAPEAGTWGGSIWELSPWGGTGDPPTQWGIAKWGSGAPWGAPPFPMQQFRVDWNWPLVFKQLNLRITFAAAPVTRIGNLYMRYQVLGYPLQAAAAA
jgi:hypothetical protein